LRDGPFDYYLTHPITAAGGTNIVYETHVYDPASDFNALFEVPGQTLPVIIGEFGEQDADALMQRAEAAEIPYLGLELPRTLPAQPARGQFRRRLRRRHGPGSHHFWAEVEDASGNPLVRKGFATSSGPEVGSGRRGRWS
jgi:hypothetical protein